MKTFLKASFIGLLLIFSIVGYSQTATLTANKSGRLCYNELVLFTTSSPLGIHNHFTLYQDLNSGGTFPNWQEVDDNTSGVFLVSATVYSSPRDFRVKAVITPLMGSPKTYYTNEVPVYAYQPHFRGSVTGDETLCYDITTSPITGYVNSSNTGYDNYQWQSSTDEVNWYNISGATSNNYSPGKIYESTYYRRIDKHDDQCSDIITDTVLKTIYPEFTAGQIGNNTTICYNSLPGEIYNIASATGGDGSYSYRWQESSNGIQWFDISGAYNPFYAPGRLTADTYYRRRVTNTCGTLYSNIVKITVNPPLVSGTIGSDQSICNDTKPSRISFLVDPSGGTGSYVYQWEESTDGSNFNDVVGASSRTLSPDKLQRTTYYRCRVGVSDGSCIVTITNTICINVHSRLVPSTIMQDEEICYNSTPSVLNVVSYPSGGSGSGSYQWQQSTNNSSFSDIAGATNNSSYQPDPLTRTTFFRQKLTDAKCGVVYSNSVETTVRPEFKQGDINGTQTICYDAIPAPLKTTVNPSGGDGTFSQGWQFSQNSGVTWNYTGVNTDNYQPGNLKHTTLYRKAVMNTCGTLYTDPVTITVRSNFLPGVIGSNQSIDYNTQPQRLSSIVPAVGGTGSYTYQWKESTDGSFWRSIHGATGESYQPGKLTETTMFRRDDSSGDCGTKTTNFITIVVYDPLTPGTIGSSQEICYNSSPSLLITYNYPAGGNGSYTVQWQESTNNSSFYDISGATSNNYSPGQLKSNRYYRKKVNGGSSGIVYTNSILISVFDEVEPGSISSSQDICYGTAPLLLNTVDDPEGGRESYTYQWQISNNMANWQNVPAANQAHFQPSNLTTTSYFRKAVIDACETKYTNFITINVSEEFLPGSVGIDQTIEFNTQPERLNSVQTPQGGSGSYTYQWQESNDNSTWINIAGATSESYQPGSLTQTMFFRRNVTSGDCGTKTTNYVTINVNGALNPGNIISDQTICFDAIPNILSTVQPPSGGNGTYNIQWQKSNNITTWTNINGANSSSYSPGNLRETTYYRKQIDGGTSGIKYTNHVEIKVVGQLNPGTISSSQSICYNSVPEIISTADDATGGSGSYTFQWQESVNGVTWNNINGENKSYYQPSNLIENKYYRKSIIDICDIVNTPHVLIEVYSDLIPGTVGNDQAIDYNATPDELVTINPSSGGTGTYSNQWQESVDNSVWVNIAEATNENYQPGSISETKYFRKNVKSGKCGSKATNSITIGVYDELNPGLIGDAQEICHSSVPNTLITKSEPSGGTGTFSYQWQKNTDGITWSDIEGETFSSLSPENLTETTSFRKIVSSGNLSIPTNSVRIDVLNAIPIPVTDLAHRYCKNSDITINIISPSEIYSWYDNQMVYLGDNNYFTVNNISENVTVFVKNILPNSCESSLAEINIIVDSIKADFYSDVTVVDVGNAVKFTNTSRKAVSYEWNFYEGEKSFEESPWHYYNTAGTFDVKLIVESINSCKDSITYNDYISVTGESTNLTNNSISTLLIYPLPVKDYVKIENSEKVELIKIYNSLGDIVYIETPRKEKLNIDMSGFTQGLYMIFIEDKNGHNLIRKVIKQ